MRSAAATGQASIQSKASGRVVSRETCLVPARATGRGVIHAVQAINGGLSHQERPKASELHTRTFTLSSCQGILLTNVEDQPQKS